ncbi:MAG: hypothetical protein KIS66_15260 [Fimbriimonadaceae bacterium]|nr:hypothetical protein [Fimbriimonadaceae bacterium]
MARNCASLLLLALFSSSWAQSFGRFGYVREAALPGLTVDAAGFRANHPSADRVRFATASDVWSPVSLNEVEQTVVLRGAIGTPNKLRASLLGAGCLMYFPNGIDLRLGSTGAPYLSWGEGSIGPGNPTPASPWLALSFRDAQPPLMFVGMDKPLSLKTTGRPGQWRIQSDGPYAGWVKVVTPLGTEGRAATTASALGEIVKRIRKRLKFWTQPVPVLLSTKVTDDGTSVTATWEFDKPGAMVPQPVILAPLGGYGIKLQTPYEEAEVATEQGPVAYCMGLRLTVRFPLRRVPSGRSLASGDQEEMIGSASPLDVPTVVEYALSCLSPQCDPARLTRGKETLRAFLGEVAYGDEPITGQRLPFEPSGKGADLVAAHAILMQGLDASGLTSEPNSLLTSLVWRRDWYTWRFHARDAGLARRTSALASIAAALCPEPRRRLEGAMLHAGLAAERGYAKWLANRRRGPAAYAFSEPMAGLRDALFLNPAGSTEGKRYLESLCAEIRTYSDLPIWVEQKGTEATLSWPSLAGGTTELALGTGYPVRVVTRSNLESFEAREGLGSLGLKGRTPLNGRCSVVIARPEWAGSLPSVAPIPRWEEPMRGP